MSNNLVLGEYSVCKPKLNGCLSAVMKKEAFCVVVGGVIVFQSEREIIKKPQKD